MCEALNEALRGRFIDSREHNWNCLGCTLQCDYYPASASQNHIWRQGEGLHSGGFCLFNIVNAPTIVDPKIAAYRPPTLLKAFLERHEVRLTLWFIFGSWCQHAYAPHSLALLRSRRERPCCSTTKSREKIATTGLHPPHLV